MPRAVVVTNLDKERADFDETVAVCKRRSPEAAGSSRCSSPCTRTTAWLRASSTSSSRCGTGSGGAVSVRDAEDEHRSLIDTARSELIEGVITESEDETLMDRFVGGEAIDVDVLTEDLERAVARAHFHPVMGHAVTGANVGSELILDLIVRGFPSPAEHPLPTVTGIDAHRPPPARRSGRPAVRRGHQDHQRPLCRQGVDHQGLLGNAPQ